jgi:hypothetical protein
MDKENAVIIETANNLKKNLLNTENYPKLDHKLYGSK